MDDVIFSGSSARPGRNIAEVEISLDNRDRTAPAGMNDAEELSVVRRIERNSGSHYRVNGGEVRARDVQLLFADSATGPHSTALVSQGRVGALISAKPAERRALLEEAAGITGLHSRRHEAELRLRAAEANLERLEDVVAALEAQLKNLKRQARQASRYRNLADHIRRHEAILLHLESVQAKTALDQAHTNLADSEATVRQLTQDVASAATQQAQTASSLPDLRRHEARRAAAAVGRSRQPGARSGHGRRRPSAGRAALGADRRRSRADHHADRGCGQCPGASREGGRQSRGCGRRRGRG
jgi:chromosome segregation protein